MSYPRNRGSMPIAFVSTSGPGLASLSDGIRLICGRYEIDPDALGWGEPVTLDSARGVQERIEASSLFIGIYGTDDSYSSRRFDSEDGSRNVAAFELEQACDRLDRFSVLCFEKKGTEMPSELTELLDRHERSITRCAFEEQRDLVLAADKRIKEWRRNQDHQERRSVLSIRVECRDRHGVLATLADLVFRDRGSILRAEHRNHLHRSEIRVIVSWPRSESIEPGALKVRLEKALETLFGVADASVTVTPILEREGVVETRGIFRILFFDGAGVAEKIFGVLADDQLSIVESRLLTLPGTPPLGRLELAVNAGGSKDERLSVIATRLEAQPNVIQVDRSTERGEWWY